MKIYTNTLNPSEAHIRLCARAVNESIKEFFKNPDNQRSFEEWKKKKEVANGKEGNDN